MLALLALIINSIWVLASKTSFGENDFVGYWSATYLISTGQNPYNPELMESTQKTKLETSQDEVIMAWNPPTLFIFLLPLALLPFFEAKFVWILINLSIIIAVGLILNKIYNPNQNSKLTLANVLFPLLFPPVISGLYMGQVTFLVLLGLTASVYFIKRSAWFWAGMALILTSIKPHLVILTIPYLVIYMIRKRKLNGWAGMLTSGVICIIILFLFRPDWVNDLIGLSSIAPVNWATPTIGGLLSSMKITESARYLIVVFFPLPFLLAWYSNKFSLDFSVALLTLITIPFTFFGWNYDQSMLLIPISLIFTWLASSNKKLPVFLVAIAIMASLAVNVYLRLLSTNDLFFVWVPIFWCLLFPIAWYLSTLQNNYEQTNL